MKKAILLFTLLLSAMNIMAQSYPFTVEKDKYATTLRMNNYVYTNMGIYARLILIEGSSHVIEDSRHGLFLELYDTDYDVPRQIYEKIGEGRRLNILLVLENKETIDCGGHNISRSEDKDKHGIQINLNCGDNDFKKLMASNIAGVGIFGLSEEPMIILLPSFNSAATLKAMYEKCSSTSISSGPSASATAEIGFIGILSDGEIYCRLDNVQINGAKGKEVKILVEFDDVNTDDNVFVLDKTVIPTYDNTTYNKSIVLHRNVNDSYSFPPNGGRFKVYAEFLVESGNKTKYGKELLTLGETSSKYIYIYKTRYGDWKSN